MIDVGYWLSVRDADDRARALYLRHYSANKNHSVYRTGKFTGPGEYMLLLGSDCLGVWLWRLERFRQDGQAGVNCAVFRNEGPLVSSELIREADRLAWRRWPGLRHFTYVDPTQIASQLPGYCFRRARWRHCGQSAEGKLLFERLAPVSA